MLACLVCTRTVDDVGGGGEGPHGSETKTISTKHGLRLFTFQLKQMASRFTAGALYKNCRPGCVQVTRHDMPNGNPVVHPSSDEAHETHSPQFSLKSYKIDDRARTPGRQDPCSTPEITDFKGTPLKSVRPLRRIQSQSALSDDGSVYGTPSPVTVVKGVDSEWVAQVEPGVYITFFSSPDGFNDLKRIKFSRNMYSKEQAESWWTQNCAMVRELYNVRPPSSTAVDDDRFSSGYATPDAYSNSHKSPCHSYNGDYQLTKRKVATDARSITSEKSETGNEWVEQDEPGVYLTIIYVQGVGKQLKRVRFSRDKYSEAEASLWWDQNKQRVYARYIGSKPGTS
ncbi:hypothetical protein MPTK1_1g24560 [Marchantia polymorpha subsp. ruderalis]|uniref:BRX domain-containing protein n=2 Tax=Marchantia polymorpha TaxID=3197 RepID=A0AAF6ATV5_MARPO|nr:hypothetical protein MARPO_0061s0066 [Marchantia polymorpha]BBM99875.1 hypothetical protein Mp_1g24560 [Marchantia polymorpha subsp. ruderalis]|eukprot:PTQ36810.1 hypothetical protein MARPO_0061s0066 [Marchantia polymorpha]